MNNLEAKYDDMKRTQREIRRIENIIDAESIILKMMIEEALRRGAIAQ